jgi:hypothetical protein
MKTINTSKSLHLTYQITYKTCRSEKKKKKKKKKKRKRKKRKESNMEILTFSLSEMKAHPCGPLGPRSANKALRNHIQLSLVFASTTAIEIGYMLSLAFLPITAINYPL